MTRIRIVVRPLPANSHALVEILSAYLEPWQRYAPDTSVVVADGNQALIACISAEILMVAKLEKVSDTA
jgi:hypothetical protein